MNVTLAKEEVRKLQAFIFDRHTSPQSLFDKSQQIIGYMDKAEKEVNHYNNQINAVLNTLSNKGALTDDLLQAFTTAGVDSSIIEAIKKVENNK